MYEFLIGADVQHMVVAVAGVLLFFGAVADLMRPIPRPWRRFGALSVVCLAMGAYSSPLRDILVFVSAWIGIVTMIVFVDTYEESRRRVQSAAVEPKDLHNWSDLPLEAQLIIAETMLLCGSHLNRDSIAGRSSESDLLNGVKYTLSETAARYIPDTIDAYRRDRDRLIVPSDSSDAEKRSEEFLRQICRLHDNVRDLIQMPAGSPALAENAQFLAERFRPDNSVHNL